MSFGNGWKHEDMSEMLEVGNYKAEITKAELKSGNYGDYIQAEVEVEGHPKCNPHIFLLNDRPTDGFNSMSAEEAQKMWDKKITAFFASFAITEGDFEPSHWVGKVGEITVQQQKKNSQYNEIVPYKTKPRELAKKEAASTSSAETNETAPDIF